MNYLWSESFARNASFSLREDILIQKILFTHDPDGRLLDSELCLRAVEAIMSHASASQVLRQEPHCFEICSIEVDGSEEPLAHTIYRLSREILRLRSVQQDMCTKPLVLFDMLGKYGWDAKLALVLSAFAMIYGEFWVINQTKDCNPLASLISLLKDLPLSLQKFKLIFIAIKLLVNAMVMLTRIVVLFESLPILDAELDDDDRISTTKSLVYVAAYWICRSVLICASKLADIRASKDSQVSEITLSCVVWDLASLEHKMRSISDELKLRVNTCRMEVGLKIHQKLFNLSSETQDNNQKVLRMLFSFKDAMPLKHPSSQEKLGTSEVADKVVLLLISKPEILPIDELLLLVQRIYDHPLHYKSNEGWEIIWIPVASSGNWSDNEIIIYDFLSSSLPWYSVRRPWSMPLTTISYIKNVWDFKDQPIIVALDPYGQVKNSNAIDMVWIWGARAFPFTTSKEEELWIQEENWTIKLLVDSVSPLLSMWAEGERVICIYGSNNVDWIREFTARMTEIQRSVEHLEVVHVGKKCPDEKVRNIMTSINKEKLSSCLTWNRMQLFWIRLESMRRSRLRLGKTANSDHILREVEELIEMSENDNGSGWMIVGSASSTTNILKLSGQELIKALSRFSVWQNYIPKLGFVNAIRLSQETLPEQPCYHSTIIKFDEATEESLICEKCKRPMKKFIVFDNT